MKKRAMSSRLWAVLGVALAVAVAGCTTTSEVVDGAKASYQAAARDPALAEHAAVPLYEAKQSLDRAERLLEAGEREEADHVAGLVEQRVAIARSLAAAGAARAQAEAFYEERDRVQVEVRSQAVTRAKQEALAAQQSAESARSEVLMARAEAETSKAEAEAARLRAEEAEAALADLKGQQTDRGYVLTLGGDVLFDTGKSLLNPGAQQNLYQVVTFLREHPDRSVLVEGHTDSAGSEDYNQGLSQRRADVVAAFLVKNGIDSSRVNARGYGESFPTVSNDTPAGRQQNRRVELIISNPGEQVEERVQ